jgi:hypothetical protein
MITGFFAYRLTQNEWDLAWQKSHRPSLRVLKSALASAGLKELTDLKDKQRVMRSLPVSTDEEGRLWYTLDLEWIATFVVSGDSFELRCFCRSCQGRIENWTPSALGWNGFEALLNVLDHQTHGVSAAAHELLRKKAVRRDPRQVIY